MTDRPEPGWYEDPSDGTRARRWDGDGWTDQTMPMPTRPTLPGLIPRSEDDGIRYAPDDPPLRGAAAVIDRVRSSDRRLTVGGGVLLVLVGLSLAVVGFTRAGRAAPDPDRSVRAAATVTTAPRPTSTLATVTTVASRDGCRAAFHKGEQVLDQTIPFTTCSRDDFIAISFEEAQALAPGYNRSWWGAYSLPQSCAEMRQRNVSPLPACDGVD